MIPKFQVHLHREALDDVRTIVQTELRGALLKEPEVVTAPEPNPASEHETRLINFLAEKNLLPDAARATDPIAEIALAVIQELIERRPLTPEISAVLRGATPPKSAAKSAAKAKATTPNGYDPAWQNADGTLREISRDEARALSGPQKAARETAKQRLYQAAHRAKKAHGAPAATTAKKPAPSATNLSHSEAYSPLVNGHAPGEPDEFAPEAQRKRLEVQETPGAAGRLA